jgi:hypothetical protein
MERSAMPESRIARFALHPGYMRESINSDHIEFKPGIARW